MEKLVKTKKVQRDTDRATQDAHIYITRMDDARHWVCDWSHSTYDEIYWSKYQIKETDHRTKTATFTSNNYLDLTTGSYRVMITSPMHEDFGGVVLKVEYDPKTELYNYTCQDGTRFHLNQIDMRNDGTCTVYDMLRDIITRGNLPVNKKPTKKQLEDWKLVLAGLHPLKDYDKWCGNMMRLKPQMIIKGKKNIDVVRALVSGEGSNVDVFFDKYGILHIDPYNPDDFFKTGLHLQSRELSDAKFTFDTTNVITGVQIENSDKTEFNAGFGASELIGLNLTAFFGKGLNATVQNNMETSLVKATPVNGDKTSSDKINTDNPYGTKRKAVEVSFDDYKTRSKDRQLLNEICAGLEKNGWKILQKIQNSNGHTESYMKHKDCVHLMVVNGIDADMIKEETHKTSFTKKMKKLNCRPVLACIGCRNPPSRKNDIRKGGNAETKIKASSDGTGYVPKGTYLKNPRKLMIKGKIPFLYGANPSEIVAKFLKGGDEPEAL